MSDHLNFLETVLVNMVFQTGSDMFVNQTCHTSNLEEGLHKIKITIKDKPMLLFVENKQIWRQLILIFWFDWLMYSLQRKNHDKTSKKKSDNHLQKPDSLELDTLLAQLIVKC